jgi:hypothetical protein
MTAVNLYGKMYVNICTYKRRIHGGKRGGSLIKTEQISCGIVAKRIDVREIPLMALTCTMPGCTLQ